MATVIPPIRDDISGTAPNPSNAVARTAFGVLHDYLMNLLGSAGTPAAARTALDIKQLQSIDYAFSSGALILKLNPTNRDYRSTTLTSGTPVNVSNASQLTLTISNGSTLGTVSGVQSDIAIISINNAGTMELAAVNLAGGATLDETGLITTVAEGGAGAADSATVFYSNTARTGVAYRVEGIFRSTQTTAGAWAQTPTLVQGVGGLAAIPKRLLQDLTYQTGAVATGTTIITLSDSIPQITEGDQYMSLAITPTSATSRLEILVRVAHANNSVTTITTALFRDSVANALCARSVYSPAASERCGNVLGYSMIAGTTSQITFRVRIGGSGAGTTTFNGSGGSRYFGGVLDSVITIKEYAA